MIAQSSFASIIETSSKWDGTSIEVCWGKNEHLGLTLIKAENLNSNESFDNGQVSDKKRIQKIITTNYNLNNAGIELIGWENCDVDSELINEDVILFLNSNGTYDKTSESRASIGKVKEPHKKSFVLIRKLSTTEANFLTADEHLDCC